MSICKFGYQLGTDNEVFGNCLVCPNENYNEWVLCKMKYKSCSSKAPYKDETIAQIESNRNNKGSVYKCYFCDMWHISS